MRKMPSERGHFRPREPNVASDSHASQLTRRIQFRLQQARQPSQSWIGRRETPPCSAPRFNSPRKPPRTNDAYRPSRLSKVDLEPVALALVAAGHFGAGVAEMLLNVGFLDLSGGGEAGAQRVAAEREAPLALGKVATKAGGQRACLDEPHDVLVGQPLPRNPAVLARDRPEEGTMADAAEPQPGFEESDRAGVGARAAADFDVAPAGLAADGQERAFGEDLDPAGAVFGLAGPAIEADDFGAAQAAGEADRQDRPVAQAPQIHLQRRQHGQELIGEDRSFL